MPRFVLLRHEYPPGFGKPSHWDFMLEDSGSLVTWSLSELPTPGGPAVAATRLADHRLAYLDYEGPVSGNRGHVKQVDAGEFAWVERKSSQFVVDLTSELLQGQLLLEEIANHSWRVRFRFAPHDSVM